MLNKAVKVDGLPILSGQVMDFNGNPGKALWRALCSTCNVKPQLKLDIAMPVTAPKCHYGIFHQIVLWFIY